MSDSAFRLLERHQKLDDHLRRAQGRRFPDPFEIIRLKKLKLIIKERLARLARHPARMSWRPATAPLSLTPASV